MFDDDYYTPLFTSFAGAVVAAGDDLNGFTPGANVCGLQYSNEGKIIRLNSSCCRSLTCQTSVTVDYPPKNLLQLLTKTLQELVSLTEALCHAYYALVHLASLQGNEVSLLQYSDLTRIIVSLSMNQV